MTVKVLILHTIFIILSHYGLPEKVIICEHRLNDFPMESVAFMFAFLKVSRGSRYISRG